MKVEKRVNGHAFRIGDWVIEFTYGIGITLNIHKTEPYVNTQQMRDDVTWERRHSGYRSR